MHDESFGGIKVRARSCSLCTAPADDAISLPYGRAPWSVVKCRTCAFVYMPVVPLHEELVETLSWDRRHGEEAARRKRDNPIIQYLDAATRKRLHLFKRVEPVDYMNRLGPASGDVVDLGCGDGTMLLRIHPRFRACGVEISAALASRAQARVEGTGGVVVQATARKGLAGFADRSLAGVILRSFLEHDADIREVMIEVGRKLRPDGVAIVKVPNYGSINRRVMGAKWCGFRLPDHVNYLTTDTITRFADCAQLRTILPFMHTLPTDDNLIAVLRPGSR